MGWLRLVGSLKLLVSFAEYSLFYRALFEKWPIILRSLLIGATPYYIMSRLKTHKSNPVDLNSEFSKKEIMTPKGSFAQQQCFLLLMLLYYRVAKTRRIPYLYLSFSAKEPYNSWLCCGKWPAPQGILWVFATLYWPNLWIPFKVHMTPEAS